MKKPSVLEKPLKLYSSQFASERRLVQKELALQKDDVVGACLQVLSTVVLSGGWTIQSNVEQEQELWARLEQVHGFQESMEALVLAIATRFSVVEIVWGKDYFPILLRPIPHELIILDFGDALEPDVYVQTFEGREKLPPERRLLIIHRPTIRNPEGTSILSLVEGLLKARNAIDQSLRKYAERFGAPLILGRYDPSLNDDEVNALLQSLKQLQSASVAVVPGTEGSASVDLLEPKGSGSAQILLDIINQLDRRIARALLGPILPLFEAQFGTRAQAQVHLDMLRAVIRYYQQLIESSINAQLWAPLCWYQLARMPEGAAALREPHLVDADKLAQWVAALVQVGVLDPQSDAQYVRQLLNLPLE